MKRELVTGVTGRDGSYLAGFLLDEIHGIKRRASLFKTQWVDLIHEDPHTDNIGLPTLTISAPIPTRQLSGKLEWRRRRHAAKPRTMARIGFHCIAEGWYRNC